MQHYKVDILYKESVPHPPLVGSVNNYSLSNVTCKIPSWLTRVIFQFFKFSNSVTGVVLENHTRRLNDEYNVSLGICNVFPSTQNHIRKQV